MALPDCGGVEWSLWTPGLKPGKTERGLVRQKDALVVAKSFPTWVKSDSVSAHFLYSIKHASEFIPYL